MKSSQAEWAIGELLTDPEKLFVLWAVSKQFCLSAGDFRQNYGEKFPADELVEALVQDGFLRRKGEAVVLTDLGVRTIAIFRDTGASPEAIVKQSKSSPRQARRTQPAGRGMELLLSSFRRLLGRDYPPFEFRAEGINTEHAGKLLYYVDLCRLFDGSSYDELDEICNLMASDIEARQVSFDFIVGLPLVGSHIGVLVARRLRVPYAVFGKERKTQRVKGPADLVEGYAPKANETALIFDDAIVTGTSIKKAALALRKAGIAANYAYAFLDKGHGGTELLAREGVYIFSFVRGDILTESLCEHGLIQASELNLIRRETEQARARWLGSKQERKGKTPA
jgi:orotate phosphoribosyltransferase